MPVRPIRLALLIGALTLPGTVLANACEAKSGAQRVALLELYTSEGCDSCPPADRWIAEIPARGLRNDRLVPLAWHVDYWNDLGWTDVYSQHLFTERQREFAHRAHVRTIYTPQFVLNGRDYRGGSHADLQTQVERTQRLSPGADLALQLDRDGADLRVRGEAKTNRASAAGVFLALYENHLGSSVRAGENRGKELRHEFVVRTLIGPLPLGAGGKLNFDQRFTLKPDWKPADLGVAAFVQESVGTDVLQALALPLCPTQGAQTKNP